MFDRLSLVSLGNEEILQLGFLMCYLAEQTDLESFGSHFPGSWSTTEVHSGATSFSCTWEKALSDN